MNILCNFFCIVLFISIVDIKEAYALQKILLRESGIEMLLSNTSYELKIQREKDLVSVHRLYESISEKNNGVDVILSHVYMKKQFNK